MNFNAFLGYIGLGGYAKWFKGKFSSKTAVQRKAIAGFDHLITDYAKDVEFPVIRDGRQYTAKTSIARIGVLDARMIDDAERELQGILSELRAANIITNQNPGVLPRSPTGYPGIVYDSRLSDPLRFMEAPPRVRGVQMNQTTCAYEPSAFPVKWPRVQRVTPVYATPKLFNDRSAFSDDAIITFAGRTGAALSKYLRGSNCFIRRHPLMLNLFAPVEYWGDTVEPLNSAAGAQARALKDEFGAAGFEQYWTRVTDFMVRMPPEMADPASASLSIVTSALVLRSLRDRMKSSDNYGESGDHKYYTAADATMEFVRLLQIASACLEIGDKTNNAQGRLVHLHATTLADSTMRRLGYSQLGQPQGSNLFAYLNALEQEAAERRLKKSNNLVQGLGGAAIGPNDDPVSAAIVATLELALKVCVPLAALGPAGVIVGIVAVLVVGLVALVSWLMTDDEVPRPDQNVLHDSGNNCFPGITARAAILEAPMVKTQYTETGNE